MSHDNPVKEILHSLSTENLNLSLQLASVTAERDAMADVVSAARDYVGRIPGATKRQRKDTLREAIARLDKRTT